MASTFSANANEDYNSNIIENSKTMLNNQSTSTTDQISDMTSQVLTGNWDNMTFTLTDWQKSKLENVAEVGIRCLLKNWLTDETNLTRGSFCNATWDNVYCWPPTPKGNVVTRPCSEILQNTEPSIAHHIQGEAVRICSENGTWLWGNWTNYTACADSYEKYIYDKEEERKLVVLVQHILFIGSVISAICLVIALIIFQHFRCLRCDRVTVHIHFMLALLLRSLLLVVITEPFIFNRSSHYRHVDIICKAVLSVNLYATVASVNWMFVQGFYLHGKLTTNVFDQRPPFKLYYIIGWVFPLLLIIAYAITLEVVHPVHCWKDYSERSEIWILLGPMIFALVANLLFLINIMRILLTKVQLPNSSSDSVQLRRAVKATFFLFPLLGLNNLLFLYNPGGDYQKYFVFFNTVFGSTQGIFVSIFYCFLCKDVKNAIQRLYHRYTARRSANSGRSTPSRSSSVLHHTTIRTRSKTHFWRKLNRRPQQAQRSERVTESCSSLELVIVHNELKNGATSLTSSFIKCDAKAGSSK